jgi:hypothetical protein
MGNKKLTSTVRNTYFFHNCKTLLPHDFMKFIKLDRLRWAGHVIGMEESDPAKCPLY